MFHRRYSNCRPQNSTRYNRIICQTVENTSFLERLSCILQARAKGYQGSNFRFRVPFDSEILQISDQKSVFLDSPKGTHPVMVPLRELKIRRRRRQRKRQKRNRFRLEKQQLRTCITLFCTFLCRVVARLLRESA